jgi:hypothetical protein
LCEWTCDVHEGRFEHSVHLGSNCDSLDQAAIKQWKPVSVSNIGDQAKLTSYWLRIVKLQLFSGFMQSLVSSGLSIYMYIYMYVCIYVCNSKYYYFNTFSYPCYIVKSYLRLT